jgi:anaerobic magnesium-protoporphyrin IX monomethyl ester cyclase
MEKHPVVFIAYKDYDNLGIGYMASILSEAGYKSTLLDFRKSKMEIRDRIRAIDPAVVGFSIIFHEHINLFRDLIIYLRKEGIVCHFTAGGHYASLRYEELFTLIPQLDSIVRFEGEYTFLDLVKCLTNGADWEKIQGMAFRTKKKVTSNPLRPLEKDLDNFPFPLRLPLKEYAIGKKYATIIAGRGCIYSCSFCNTRKFYSLPPGPVKRIRRPEMVVREMEYLYKQKDCSIFLFQDDDFPVNPKYNGDWVRRFCNELERVSLSKNIMWKINCRPDEVNMETFSLMKKNGLFHTFLGIEDGTDIGLKRFNKHLTVEESIKGINILRKLNIGFDYGFILFHPFTTYDSLDENLNFLLKICGDGYSTVPFQKLIPIYETKVEKELIDSGRLIFPEGFPDFSFLEESMNRYYDFVFSCFNDWLRDPEGVENISKCARNYFPVYLHYNQSDSEILKHRLKIKKLISESNIFLMETMKELADIFRAGQYVENNDLLDFYKERTRSKHIRLKYRINNSMADFLQAISQKE